MSTVDSKQSYTLYEIKFSIKREMEIIKLKYTNIF